MVPTDHEIQNLWKRYNLPPEKQTHVRLVDAVSGFLAAGISEKQGVVIDTALLHAAALLHDIDKNADKLPGEQHPDACVRILKEEGMAEVAELVKTHPLHAILDPSIAPKTWEAKILFLADKMVKYDVITVDKRFELWRAENLSAEARMILDRSYPNVKDLERQIFTVMAMAPEDIAKVLRSLYIGIR
jgi:HD superfamily phosphodiesterase